MLKPQVLAQELRLTLHEPKVGPKASILGPKCVSKVTKNVPGDKKARPETAPQAFFVVFSCRCRSDSLSGPIFEGSDPTKSCPHY